MKRFIGFIIKEFYHILRDRRSMLILFGIPVVQVILFGAVLTNEIKDANVAILDLSKDEITQKIIGKIGSSGYFKIDKYLDNFQQIEPTFKDGDVGIVVVFPANFSQQFTHNTFAKVQIIADASEPNTANLLVNYLNSIIKDYSSLSINQNKMPMQIVPEVRMLYNERLKGVYMFIPGILAMILLLVSAMMTSISIAREKELGTMEILLVSPLKPFQIIIGKVAPYVLLSFLNGVVIILLGVFVFGLPIHGSVWLLLFETLLYITLSLSLGIFISTTAKTQQTAMMASMFGLMLPTILLSGFVYPIENMPLPLQIISNVIPPRWFIVILKNIMLKGTGFVYVWKETLILIFMTIVFIGLSVKKFKTRLE